MRVVIDELDLDWEYSEVVMKINLTNSKALRTSAFRLAPEDKLAAVLEKLPSDHEQVTVLDISGLKSLGLEDFRALLKWEKKDRLTLLCTDAGLRSFLYKLRLHTQYQVIGAAA